MEEASTARFGNTRPFVSRQMGRKAKLVGNSYWERTETSGARV
jgi:hypothetical protein